MAARIANQATTERLHEITMNGMCETSGDVESPPGWFALVPDDGTWYLLVETILGFRHGYAYDSEEEARGIYEALDREYSEWLDS